MTGQRPAQVYVYDKAARAELIASARRAAEQSGVAQWIHEHPFGHPCNDGCGLLQRRAAAG